MHVAAAPTAIEKENAMAKRVRDLMNRDPIKLGSDTPVVEAARRMREANVGAVIVVDEGKLIGIVTDRDITVRAVARGLDPKATPLADICSNATYTIAPDDNIDQALAVMRENAVRRVPVVDGGNQAVGILSLGDLALERDPRSVLGRISAAQPSR
jgi:CBS domain-containing protein